MNETAKGTTMYEAIPVVSELNRVAGFDPLRFAHRVAQQGGQRAQLKLDLKYKKLWFRLKYPQGRLKVTPLRITEQIAIFEAKVYFDKKDTEPVSSCISTQNKQGTPGGLYIEYAQRSATEQALDDAGFGLQLVNLPDGRMEEPVPAADRTTASAHPAAPAAPVNPAAPELAAEPPAAEGIHAEKAAAAVPPAAAQPAEAVQNTPCRPEHLTPVEEEPAARQPEPTASVETAQADATAQESEQDEDGEDAEASPYTPDMPVEEICARMTLDEARSIIVDTGTCKGWPLSQVAERRPASLRFYLNGYQGGNNILRAGAKLLADSMESMGAAG